MTYEEKKQKVYSHYEAVYRCKLKMDLPEAEVLSLYKKMNLLAQEIDQMAEIRKAKIVLLSDIQRMKLARWALPGSRN